jgi:hypothetical protein
MKKGVKTFGNDGVDAVRSESQQLHDRSVIRPQLASDISKKHKLAAFAYLMFLKRKGCGKIKGWDVPTRAYIPREDPTSPQFQLRPRS